MLKWSWSHFRGCKQRNFKFLMIGTCSSCQNTPISTSIKASVIQISKIRIFDQSRVLKRGVVTFSVCKQRNFKFLIIGKCFSCQNTPISMPNRPINTTIKKLIIFGGARELKMGVVNFHHFPSTFLLRTFFWCYSTL